MSLVEMLERQTKALRARDVARIFEVTPQYIYKMAASGKIPADEIKQAISRWSALTAPVHAGQGVILATNASAGPPP
jgi:hypothetical protein